MDNLEDGELVLEQLESALFDDVDCGEMPPPSTTMVTLIGTSSSTTRSSYTVPQLPLPSTQLPFAFVPLPPHGGTKGNCGGAKRKEK